MDNPVAHLTEYDLKHLAAHLEEAERSDDLHRLLALETKAQRNAWYEAKEAIADTEGYLADINRAWRLAEAEFTSDRAPVSPGLQVRYALIMTSFNSLAKNIPPELLASLAAKGIWTPAQGLAYAQQLPDPAWAAMALVGLVPYLPPTEQTAALQKVLATAQVIEQDSWIQEPREDGKILPKLSAQLLKAGRPVEAGAVARLIKQESEQGKALAGLATHLIEQGQVGPAMETIRAMPNEAWHIDILIPSAASLPPPYLAEALKIVGEMKDDWSQVRGLAGLGPYLPEELWPEAVAMVLRLKDPWRYAQGLAAVAPYLPLSFLPQTLTLARAIDHKEGQAAALGGLALRLARLDRPAEAMAAIKAIRDDWGRARALEGLIPALPEAFLGHVLAVTRDIHFPEGQVRVLKILAPRLKNWLHFEEALAIARAIGQEIEAGPASPKTELAPGRLSEQMMWGRRYRAQALARLAAYLPAPYREQVWQEALDTGLVIDDKWLRDEVAPLLGEFSYSAITLAALREIKPVRRQAEVLIDTLPHVPKSAQKQALQEVMAVTQTIEDEKIRIETLIKLATQLVKLGYPAEALVTIQAIEDEQRQAATLIKLGLSFVEQGYSMRALIEAQAVQVGWQQWGDLAKLAARLVERGYTGEGLALMRMMSENYQAGAFIELAPYLPSLPEAERAQILQESLATARRTGEAADRLKLLAALAPYLAPALLQEALAATQTIGDNYHRTKTLAQFKSLLAAFDDTPPGQSINLPDPKNSRPVSAGQFGFFLNQEQEQVVQEALLQATARPRWPNLLANLLAYIGISTDPTAGRRLRADLLANIQKYGEEPLAEFLHRLGQAGYPQEALAGTETIKDGGYRALALLGLVPNLSEPLKAQALERVLNVAASVKTEYEGAHAMVSIGERPIDVTEIRPAQILAGLASYRPWEALNLALEKWIWVDGQVEALIAIIPHLPEILLRRVLASTNKPKVLARLAPRLAELGQPAEALAVARAIEKTDIPGDETLRPEALAGISPYLAQLSPTDLKPLWPETLRRLAGRTRRDLLADLEALAVVVAAVGGPAAITEITGAIGDVGRWWP